jgi:tetratricopeptide (TPR) repeat protein
MLLSLVLVRGSQFAAGQAADDFTIRGQVLDSARAAVAGARIRLERSSDGSKAETNSRSNGEFSFSGLAGGDYSLVAEMGGMQSSTIRVTASGKETTVDLVLRSPDPGRSNNPAKSAMEFADDPHFTIAGVTDWTAAGGHGSDVSLRTSEALNQETLLLKPNRPPPAASSEESEAKLRAALGDAPLSFASNYAMGEFYLEHDRFQEAIPFLQKAFDIDPHAARNEFDLALALKNLGDVEKAKEHVERLLAGAEDADIDRLAGEIYESAGEPVIAVHDFERAARLDPSEQNYFEWGTELLYHRAVWQAKVVFEQGIKAHPGSARLLTSLGAVLFAGALYDDAAQRLCEASDIDPDDPAPYQFMGKIEMVAPHPLACVDARLGRYVQLHPDNALGNYFYAMAVWKQSAGPLDLKKRQEIDSLLTRAVTIDPKCGDAYLQLGNLRALENDFRGALGFYEKAVQTDPRASEAHYRLGVAYDRVGDKSDAQQQFALHDQIEKEKAAEVERQRQKIKQFVVDEPAKPDVPPVK